VNGSTCTTELQVRRLGFSYFPVYWYLTVGDGQYWCVVKCHNMIGSKDCLILTVDYGGKVALVRTVSGLAPLLDKFLNCARTDMSSD
jgi:hypothetical protein